eukprot:IDg20681t1
MTQVKEIRDAVVYADFKQLRFISARFCLESMKFNLFRIFAGDTGGVSVLYRCFAALGWRLAAPNKTSCSPCGKLVFSLTCSQHSNALLCSS